MPNQITADGLETQSQSELVAEFTAAFEAIYGTDIDLSQSTPDGQMMMIFIQAVLDILDLITQVYNGMDPDNAVGVVLDQRVALNGIQRQAGTYTITPITVVNDQSVNLFGLDTVGEDPFTVQDNAGTQWYLVSEELGLAAGTHVLNFRAALPGATLTIPNTITVPVSIVLGIVSVNNPTTYTTLGINEESDAELKVRRQRSVSIASQGYLDGLLAALENITDVTYANVYENVTDDPDGYGVPGHSIWVIIAGSPSEEEVAQAIYRKRNAGCGMYGSESYIIEQVNGVPFIVYFDYVTTVPLFIKFTATSLDGINPVDIEAIREGLVESFAPGVFQQVNVNDLATQVQILDNNCLVTNAGFSLSSGGAYTSTLTPVTPDKQFVVSEANIIIIPMILNPTTSVVADGEEIQFTALGGYGTYTYTIHVNNSGATINGSTGLYEAGSTPGTDTIRVTDGLGNIADATVTVT